MRGKEPGWDLLKWIILPEFREGLIWNRSSQRESIRSIHKQNRSIAECGVDVECDVSQERNMTFTLWSHAYTSNLVKTMNYFYIMTQFWHLFCSIFHILNVAFYSLLSSICSWAWSSYVPTLFMLLGVLWLHTFQMYDFQTLSPYLLHFWGSLSPC